MTRKRRPGIEQRRNVLRGLATGLAAAVAPATAAEAATATQASPRTETETETPTPVGSGVLAPAELATLESLAELLVPGSAAAGVPSLLDRVASVETDASRRALLDALRAFEGEARLGHGRRWVALDEEAQREILSRASSAAPGTPLKEHFLSLRDRVAEAYFATEPGMRRLGFTGRTAFRELPACDPSGDDPL